MNNIKEEATKLALELNENGSPSFGEKPERLWFMLSRELISGSEASKIYRVGGYKPFMGYPLHRETYHRTVNAHL